MVEISPPKALGRYVQDVSWISDEGREMRDDWTGFYVPPMSFPGAPVPAPEERYALNWHPDMKFFSPERFVRAVEHVGWEFHGIRYFGRKPMSKWKKDVFGKDSETIPRLLPYSLTGEADLSNMVLNAKTRMQNFQPDVAFGSPVHGSYLSQELYEAGWYWIANDPDLSVIKSGEIWRGATLP